MSHPSPRPAPAEVRARLSATLRAAAPDLDGAITDATGLADDGASAWTRWPWPS